jgi:hypothetical protein
MTDYLRTHRILQGTRRTMGQLTAGDVYGMHCPTTELRVPTYLCAMTIATPLCCFSIASNALCTSFSFTESRACTICTTGVHQTTFRMTAHQPLHASDFQS